MINRFDILILVISLGLTGWSYQVFWSDTMDYEVTLHDRQGDRTMQLLADSQLTLQGKMGNSTLEIRDHKIRFTDSPCSSKQCIHSGWLSASQPVIACLPNGIMVSLNSQTPFDAINF